MSQSFQYPVPWEKCPLLENASGFGEEEVKDEKGETERRKEQGVIKKRKIVEGRRNGGKGERKRGKWGGGIKKRGGVILSSRHVQSQVPSDPECARTTPSLYFWYRMTLKASDSIEDDGPPVFSLCLPNHFTTLWWPLPYINTNQPRAHIICHLPLSGLFMPIVFQWPLQSEFIGKRSFLQGPCSQGYGFSSGPVWM